jgi:ComEC/Rec2-related protein
MKFCYFGWALSSTIGIILYNLCLLNHIIINSSFIFILIFILIFLLVFGFYIFDKNINKEISNGNSKKINIIFLILTCFMFLSLSFISTFYTNLKNNSFINLINKTNIFKNKNEDIEISAVGQILSNPEKKYNKIYFKFKIINLKIKNKNENKDKDVLIIKQNGNIFISYNYGAQKNNNNTDENFLLGDFVEVNFKDIYHDNNKNYKQDISNYNSYIFNVDKIIKNIKLRSFTYYLYKFKLKIITCINSLFSKSLKTPNDNIASAVILGQQAKIPFEIKESFKKSGIYHLLAISGLHISTIFLFVFYFSKKGINLLANLFHFRNNIKININYLVIAFIAFYVFIIGAKSQVLRASIMFSLSLFAKELHKDFKQANIFFLAYIFLIIVNPSYINNIDVGFVLSFTSVAAIIFVMPIIMKLFCSLFKLKEQINNYFLKSIFTVISINIVIGPILSYYFGGFSIISIIANFVIIPIFYIILFNLFFASLISLFWFWAGSILIKPANFFIDIMLKSSKFFENLPGSFLKTSLFNNKIVFFSYYIAIAIALIYFYFSLKKKKNYYLI